MNTPKTPRQLFSEQLDRIESKLDKLLAKPKWVQPKFNKPEDPKPVFSQAHKPADFTRTLEDSFPGDQNPYEGMK
jgi:hypothetical protein